MATLSFKRMLVLLTSRPILVGKAGAPPEWACKTFKQVASPSTAEVPKRKGTAKPEEVTHVKYDRFEQVPVWQAATKLAGGVYAMTEKPAFQKRYSLRDQIERAAVSVSNNIAEGFERRTTQGVLTFLYIARGSAGEVRSMLCLLETLPVFADLKFEISNLKSLAENISRQLRGWADSLQNSGIKGQRYLTDKSRKTDQAKRERDEFLQTLELVRRGVPYDEAQRRH
jgi:four helix bundle protein